MHEILEWSSQASFWINSQSIRLPILINPTNPWGTDPTLQKIQENI
jgi:hypothetical protein